MDKFTDFIKDKVQDQMGGDKQDHNSSGNQYGSSGSGNYGSSGTPYGGGSSGYSNDFSGADRYAHENSEGSGDSSIFSSALSFMQNRGKDDAKNEDVDEEDMVRQHKAYYDEASGSGGKSTSDGVGKAAAMQAMKMFNSKGEKETEGGSQNAFIGMAMGQAAKLFDQQAAKGNVSEGESKEGAVQNAAKMAFKMYLKSQMSGGSGGSSGLMGMASKFM